MSELTLFNVTEDQLYERGISTPAFRFKGRYWNGWEIPHFTREQLDAYINLWGDLWEKIFMVIENHNQKEEDKNDIYLLPKDEYERHQKLCLDLDIGIGCNCNLTIIIYQEIDGVGYHLFDGWCFYDADE